MACKTNCMLTPSIKKAARATQFFFFATGLAVSSWAPMVPFAKMRLELDEVLLGLVLLAFGFGALIMMPITGWLVHRFGNRNSCIGAALFLPLIIPLLVLAPNAISLSAILFFFGGILGVMNVSMNSMAITVEANAKIPLMSSFHCLFSIGGLTGAAAMSILLNQKLQLLTTAYMISAVICLIILTQSRFLLSESLHHKKMKNSPVSLPSLSVFCIGVLCLISFLAEGAMLDWSAVYLRSDVNYDAAAAGLGYAVFSVAMATGRWTGDGLIHRYGAPFMVQMGGIIAASGLLIVLYLHWMHLEILGFFLIGLGASNIVPMLFSAAGKVKDTSPGLALTVVTTFGYTGLLLGPSVIGFVAQATTLSSALTGVAFLLGVIGLTGRVILSTPLSDPVIPLE